MSGHRARCTTTEMILLRWARLSLLYERAGRLRREEEQQQQQQQQAPPQSFDLSWIEKLIYDNAEGFSFLNRQNRQNHRSVSRACIEAAHSPISCARRILSDTGRGSSGG